MEAARMLEPVLFTLLEMPDIKIVGRRHKIPGALNDKPRSDKKSFRQKDVLVTEFKETVIKQISQRQLV